MDKYNVVYPYLGILVGKEGNEILIHATTFVNHESIILNKRN